jgi:putative peptidoglycan lipid II flippase
VMSAWCLGVLNSHDRFFLTYVSPVLWNAAIVTTAIVAGRRLAGFDDDIATWLAWGTVIGAAAQFLVQLPTVLALLRGFVPSLAMSEGVRTTLRNFVPIVIGRGSVQISGYVDQVLASFLGSATLAAMANAQTLYMLPVSLFGMAISAAELPAMAGTAGDDEARTKHVRDRLRSSLRRVVFLVIPSSIAFIAIGGSIVSLVFQTGRFGAHDTEVVWIVLAGSAFGLAASTQGRLFASALYALGQPRAPLYAALARVGIGITAGYIVVMPLRHALGYNAAWGAFGLTAAASLAAWIEFGLLYYWIRKRAGEVAVPVKLALGALAGSCAAGGAGYGAAHLVGQLGGPSWLSAVAACGVFGGVYIVAMAAAQVPEARAFTRRLMRS